jgi:hypothetical protein
MSTLATTNIKHESASTPNITLGADGTSTVNGTLNLGSSPLATPTGSAPSYTCRAWVNFDGTGTVAIRASGNVSSITDNGTGVYTINFTTAMPDSDYSLAGSTSLYMTNRFGVLARTGVESTTAVQIETFGERISDAGVSFDPVVVSVAIFR